MRLIHCFFCLLCLAPGALLAQVYTNTDYHFSLRYDGAVWQPLPGTASNSVVKVLKQANSSVVKWVASRKKSPEAEVAVFMTPVPASENQLTAAQVRAGYLLTLQQTWGVFDYHLLSATTWHTGPYEGTVVSYSFKLPFTPPTHAVTLVVRRQATFYLVTYLAKDEANDAFFESGVDLVTSLSFLEVGEPAKPASRHQPAVDSTVFGRRESLLDGLVGKLYALPETTTRLPNFTALPPFGEVYTKEINVSPRDWLVGFPGLPGTTPRVEWFGIEYSGYITPTTAGTYTFRLVSDDGAKLFLDGKLVLDNDGVHAPSSVAGQCYLNKSAHRFTLQYFQGPRFAIALQLFVTAQTGGEVVFPGRFFTLTPSYPLPPQALWQGRILDDSTRQPLPHAHLQPAAPIPAVAVDAQATFAWRAAPGHVYAYEVGEPGYYGVRGTWTATAAGRQADILLKKIRVGSIVRLEQVQFRQGTAELLPGTELALNQLLNLLHEHPTMRIALAGHTDNVGDAAKNVQLSEDRVAVVKAYLVRHGIAAPRIGGQGYGGARPIASNAKEETRRLNRRVEFTILGLE